MLNMGFMPKKTGFVFLKVQNRPKKTISVPTLCSQRLLDFLIVKQAPPTAIWCVVCLNACYTVL